MEEELHLTRLKALCHVFKVKVTTALWHPPVRESSQGIVSPLSLAPTWTPPAPTALVSRSLEVPACPSPESSWR